MVMPYGASTVEPSAWLARLTLCGPLTGPLGVMAISFCAMTGTANAKNVRGRIVRMMSFRLAGGEDDGCGRGNRLCGRRLRALALWSLGQIKPPAPGAGSRD